MASRSWKPKIQKKGTPSKGIYKDFYNYGYIIDTNNRNKIFRTNCTDGEIRLPLVDDTEVIYVEVSGKLEFGEVVDEAKSYSPQYIVTEEWAKMSDALIVEVLNYPVCLRDGFLSSLNFPGSFAEFDLHSDVYLLRDTSGNERLFALKVRTPPPVNKILEEFIVDTLSEERIVDKDFLVRYRVEPNQQIDLNELKLVPGYVLVQILEIVPKSKDIISLVQNHKEQYIRLLPTLLPDKSQILSISQPSNDLPDGIWSTISSEFISISPSNHFNQDSEIFFSIKDKELFVAIKCYALNLPDLSSQDIDNCLESITKFPALANFHSKLVESHQIPMSGKNLFPKNSPWMVFEFNGTGFEVHFTKTLKLVNWRLEHMPACKVLDLMLKKYERSMCRGNRSYSDLCYCPDQWQTKKIGHHLEFWMGTLTHRLERLLNWATGQSLTVCIVNERNYPIRAALQGFYNSQQKLIEKVYPDLNLPENSSGRNFNPVHLQMLDKKVKDILFFPETKHDKDLRNAAGCLFHIYLKMMFKSQCSSRYQQKASTAASDWRYGIFDAAPIRRANAHFAPFFNQILMTDFVLDKLNIAIPWVRKWKEAVLNNLDRIDFKINKHSETILNVQNSFIKLEGQLDALQDAFIEECYVIQLDAHSIMMRSDSIEFMLTGDIIGPHAKDNKYSWTLDEEGNVDTVKTTFLNGHEIVFRMYEKIKFLVHAIPSRGEIEMRVTAIQTSSDRGIRSWMQLHSENTAALWLPVKYFQFNKNRRRYSSFKQWLDTQLPGFIHNLATTSIRCTIPPNVPSNNLPTDESQEFEVLCHSPCLGTWCSQGFIPFRERSAELHPCLREPELARSCPGATCRYSIYPRSYCLYHLKYILEEKKELLPCKRGCGVERHPSRDVIVECEKGRYAIAHNAFFASFCFIRSGHNVPEQRYGVVLLDKEENRWILRDIECNYDSKSINHRPLDLPLNEEVQVLLYPINEAGLKVFEYMFLYPDKRNELESITKTFPHLLRISPAPKEQNYSVAELATRIKIPLDRIIRECEIIEKLDPMQLRMVWDVVVNKQPVSVLGPAGSGKTACSIVITILENMMSPDTIKVYLTQPNAPCDKFAAISCLNVTRLISSSYNSKSQTTRHNIECRTADAVGTSIVACTIDKMMICCERMEFNKEISLVIFDEGQAISDPHLFALLASIMRMNRRIAQKRAESSGHYNQALRLIYETVRLIIMGDPSQKTFTTMHPNERSMKKCHLSRLEPTTPALSVYIFNTIYRQTHPAHFGLIKQLDSFFELQNPSTSSLLSPIPPLLAYPVDEHEEHLDQKLLRWSRTSPQTWYNKRMCEFALELLSAIFRYHPINPITGKNWTVLLISAYNGDMMYWAYLLKIEPRFMYLCNHFSINYLVVDTVGSQESDIAIVSTTRTKLSNNGKPCGRFWTRERMKNACTRHRHMLALIGSPIWMMNSHFNNYRRVWKYITEAQSLVENQPPRCHLDLYRIFMDAIARNKIESSNYDTKCF